MAPNVSQMMSVHFMAKDPFVVIKENVATLTNFVAILEPITKSIIDILIANCSSKVKVMKL